ncbi:MAG: hypothetical protein WC476_05160 [Phycisphaerae bacterium]|jgi:hypothetical protein
MNDMQSPNVKHLLIDDKNGVRYEVLAYRKLSHEEVIMAVRHYKSRRKPKKPKKGTIITIVTVIGYDE